MKILFVDIVAIVTLVQTSLGQGNLQVICSKRAVVKPDFHGFVLRSYPHLEHN